MSGSLGMTKSMLGMNGLILDADKFGLFGQWLANHIHSVTLVNNGWFDLFGNSRVLIWIVVFFAMTLFLPNTQNLFSGNQLIQFRPGIIWVVSISAVLYYSLLNLLNVRIYEFIYFNF